MRKLGTARNWTLVNRERTGAHCIRWFTGASPLVVKQCSIARWRMIRQTAFSAYNTPRLVPSRPRTGLRTTMRLLFRSNGSSFPFIDTQNLSPFHPFRLFLSLFFVLSPRISLTLDVVIYDRSLVIMRRISWTLVTSKRKNIPDKKHILRIPISFRNNHRPSFKQKNNTIKSKNYKNFLLLIIIHSYLNLRFLINCYNFVTYLSMIKIMLNLKRLSKIIYFII